jgi:hypothetical protein
MRNFFDMYLSGNRYLVCILGWRFHSIVQTKTLLGDLNNPAVARGSKGYASNRSNSKIGYALKSMAIVRSYLLAWDCYRISEWASAKMANRSVAQADKDIDQTLLSK